MSGFFFDDIPGSPFYFLVNLSNVFSHYADGKKQKAAKEPYGEKQGCPSRDDISAEVLDQDINDFQSGDPHTDQADCGYDP